MRQILALLLVCSTWGCGGGSNSTVTSTPAAPVNSPVAVSQPPAPPSNPPSPITPPAEAQTYTLTNLSAPVISNAMTISGPYAGGTTGYVIQVTPDSPNPGECTVTLDKTVATAIGQSVTIANFPWATAANNGTFTLIAPFTNTPPTYTITNSCVAYHDEIPFTMTSDDTPSMVTRSGIIYDVFEESLQHDSATDTRIMVRTSSDDGATWTVPSTLAEDTASSCHASNCAVTNHILGMAGNSNIILLYTKYDHITQWTGNYYSRIFNGSTWSAESLILSGNAPDGHAWTAGYGQIVPCNGKLAAPIWNNNNKIWLIWSADNGVTWGSPTQVAPSVTMPTNEIALWCSNQTIIGIERNSKCLLLTSTNCGQPIVVYSQDAGATWGNGLLPINPSVSTTQWEMVSPWLHDPQNYQGTASTSHITLLIHERDISSMCGSISTPCVALRAITFKPADLIADPTNMGVAQILWNGTQNSSGYPAATARSDGSVLLEWYSMIYPASPAKLYTMNASYQVGSALVPSHILINGVLR